MSWNYRGGLIPTGSKNYNGQSLAIHNGLLWLAYTGTDQVVYYISGTNENWGTQYVFKVDNTTITSSAWTPPRLVEVKGLLYAFIAAPDTNEYKMYRWADAKGTWELPFPNIAFTGRPSPALLQFGEKLFRVGVNLGDNGLQFSIWDGPEKGWSSSISINEATWGFPGLFTLNDKLYIAFTSNNENRDILTAVYDSSNNNFTRSSSVGESSYYGLCTISGNGKAYIGFPANDNSGQILISENSGSGWSRSTAPDQSTFDTPTLAILSGVLNLAWNSKNDDRVILWAQRPVISYPTDSWMTNLPDITPLSGMSIPGTHDSSTFGYQYPFVPTQTMNFETQLNAGVRCFDLRCAMSDNTIQMVHGIKYLGFTLDSVLQKLYTWLDSHKGEGLIALIKEDTSPSNSNIPLSQAISNLISQSSKYWSASNTTPNLGALRGKIQLIRRYTGSNLENFGIDVSVGWPENPECIFEIVTNSGVTLSIQDHYTSDRPEDISTIVEEKYNNAKALLDAAALNTDTSRWYINFTSGYEFGWDRVLITAHQIAVGTWALKNVSGVNSRMRDNLRSRSLGKVRMGVFMMDYPEAPHGDYISTIIQFNF